MAIHEWYRTLRWRLRIGILFLRALGYRRRLSDVKFIGITGSAAKTTTKDLVYSILSAAHPVSATQESLNTTAAVSRTILRARPAEHYCIVEIAAFRPGSLDFPLRLFRPVIGALTVIGRDHYRAFKSLDAIADEKSKLIRALPASGIAILNIDDPRIRSAGEQCRCRIIWVGQGEQATIRLLKADSIWPDPLSMTIAYQGTRYEFTTNLHGTHLALPVLTALGIAIATGMPLTRAIATVSTAVPTEGRMQLVDSQDGVTFVRDDMKAPAWSLGLSLEYLQQARATRKVAIIGTLSDFSGDSSAKYRQFARQVREHADLVVFVGPNAHRALRARCDEDDRSIQGFRHLREAADYLADTLQPGDLVLLKGSRKTDHLSRLFHHRIQPVTCWREHCDRDHFCSTCEKLHEDKAFPVPARPGPPVIIGLGNPSPRYHHTPHNIGYQVIERLSDACGGQWETAPDGQICIVTIGGIRTLLLKPAANMNVCGPVIRRFLEASVSHPDHCLIVHDDMDLEQGTVRTKQTGGDAGHRGVRSVISELGTDTIRRVRIGVRRHGDSVSAGERVLSGFSIDDRRLLQPAVDQAVIMIQETLPILSGRHNPTHSLNNNNESQQENPVREIGR